ncbi:hypothetical protein BH10BAC3_BH10BAC3_07650 [soil metagenome]
MNIIIDKPVSTVKMLTKRMVDSKIYLQLQSGLVLLQLANAGHLASMHGRLLDINLGAYNNEA